jgi:hypothetical protein
LRTEDNLLKLGELHEKVKSHLEKIIAQPKLITGADMSFGTSTLNGQRWEKSEIVYAALHKISEWKLDHVDSLVVAYCKGALATWSRFDTEWSEDGPIAKLSAENVERAWLEVTNDGNESMLGIYRQAAKSAPNMSLAYHSALRMYKANGTSDFVPSLDAKARQVIRVQVRKDDASGLNTQTKHAQIVYMKEVSDRNQKRDEVRKERAEKTREILGKVTAIASVEDLDAAFEIGRGAQGYLSVAALDLQLDWHIANPVQELPNSQETSAAGIPKAKTGAKGRGTRENRYAYLKEAISKRVEILARVPEALSTGVVPDGVPAELTSSAMDVEEDGYDSEEEYYGR